MRKRLALARLRLIRQKTGRDLQMLEDKRYVKDRIYYCGYWGKFYKVLDTDGDWCSVLWEDKSITHHCTRLDPESDFILSMEDSYEIQ